MAEWELLLQGIFFHYQNKSNANDICIKWQYFNNKFAILNINSSRRQIFYKKKVNISPYVDLP